MTKAFTMKGGDCRRGRRLDRVSHAEQSGQRAVDCDKDDRLSLNSQVVGIGGQVRHVDSALRHLCRIADHDAAPIDDSEHAAPGD